LLIIIVYGEHFDVAESVTSLWIHYSIKIFTSIARFCHAHKFAAIIVAWFKKTI